MEETKHTIEKKKVLFLDVDGVLNCWSTKDRCGSYIGIDDTKVALLKEIIDATGASIVLVSTWKDRWFKEPSLKVNQDEMANYLDSKLAKFGLIAADRTFEDDYLRRGVGILDYLEEQRQKGIEITDFVILDDEIFDYEETNLIGHLVLTCFEENGLEPQHEREAIEKLMRRK